MDAHPPLPPAIWEHTPPVAQELIVAQAAALAQLRAEGAQLKATVEELAQRLGRNSRHSSPAAIGGSAPGDETVQPRVQWASARWATRP